MLGDSGCGKDGLCGQGGEWNQRCVGYIVIIMHSFVMSHSCTILVPASLQALFSKAKENISYPLVCVLLMPL